MPSLVRDEVTIANAWDLIEYEAHSGRSEATDAEVKRLENIQRLARDLEHPEKLIIFCGDKARTASEELLRLKLLPESLQIGFVAHLGVRGLRTIDCDIDGKPIVAAEAQRLAGRSASLKRIQAENTDLRLAIVVRDLLKSIRLVGTLET